MDFKFFLTALVTFYCFSAISCKERCDGKKIHFQFLAGNKGDNIKVFVDGTFRGEKTLHETEDAPFESAKHRIFSLCSERDSILVRVMVNKRDTSFYLRPKEVKECYVGNSMKDKILIILNREDNGFGEFSPVK